MWPLHKHLKMSVRAPHLELGSGALALLLKLVCVPGLEKVTPFECGEEIYSGFVSAGVL